VVITISLKGNILDWNKKSPGADILLPKPKYKEPYENYRKRIISTCNGITSPHDENIITTTVDGIEQHYLFTPHEIGFQGRNFGRLVEISEVTKSYSVLRYLEEIALYDTLTGLKNRNAYIDAVKRMVASKNMPLAIIVGDINNLKKTNDTLGHLYGDRLLMAITSIVTECAPEGALVFRIGGDELVLLGPNAEPQAVLVFEALVAEKCEHASQLEFGTPSISWGHALMTSVSQDYNEVFRFADAMMYENKRTSKEISISGIVHTDKPLDSLPPEVVQEMR
jgi:diguanylate cyclase (GGDEF)-like protein